MNAVHTRNRLRRPAPLRSRGAIQINRRSRNERSSYSESAPTICPAAEQRGDTD